MAVEDKELDNGNSPHKQFKTIYEALTPILAESQTSKEQGAKCEALCATS